MSNVLLLPIFRYLLCPGSGKQTYLNHPSLKSTKLFYDFSRNAKIMQNAYGSFHDYRQLVMSYIIPIGEYMARMFNKRLIS